MGTSRSKKRKTSPINGDGKAAIDTSPVQPEGLTQVGPKRRPWATEEDDNLRQLVGVHGVKNWALIATELHMRNGKQCRERWRNHLRPELNKGDWTEKEDVEIWNRVHQFGTKWAQISEDFMPLRTDNDIKNRWNSIIRKTTHPSGRPWKPAEDALREQVLSAARVTHQRRLDPASQRSHKRERICKLEGTGEVDHTDGEGGGTDVDESDPEHFDVGDGHFPADLLEAESPVPLRKLFGSPSPAAKTKKSPIQPAAAAAASPPRSRRSPRPTASSTPAQLNSAYKASGSTRRGAALLGGLMGRDEADALDKLVDGYVPGSAPRLAQSTVSQICSPVRNCSPMRKPTPSASGVTAAICNWFDADLDVSLSPLLTPSLRHRPVMRRGSSGSSQRYDSARGSSLRARLTPQRSSPRLIRLGLSPLRPD